MPRFYIPSSIGKKSPSQTAFFCGGTNISFKVKEDHFTFREETDEYIDSRQQRAHAKARVHRAMKKVFGSEYREGCFLTCKLTWSSKEEDANPQGHGSFPQSSKTQQHQYSKERSSCESSYTFDKEAKSDHHSCRPEETLFENQDPNRRLDDVQQTWLQILYWEFQHVF